MQDCWKVILDCWKVILAMIYHYNAPLLENYSGYGKCPKISTKLLLKILSGIANSVDPDKTTPPSGAVLAGFTLMHILFCQKFWPQLFKALLA